MHWWIGASLIVFPFALVTHTLAQYGSQCRLPSQEEGLCMPVKSCKSIYERFLKIHASGAGISQEDQKLFTERHCGTFKNVVRTLKYSQVDNSKCVLRPKVAKSHVCCAEPDIQLNADGYDILKNQSCGNYNSRKVSFGKEAALFAFPWMALLVYNDTRNAFQCGGSLITDRNVSRGLRYRTCPFKSPSFYLYATEYVLTAAHCVKGRNNLLYVRLGEHRLSTERDCTAGGKICAPPVENIEIEDIVEHENFVKFTDDIALIRLKRKVQFQRHIQPLCLPIYDGLRGKTLKEYVIAGWGRTDKELVADVLMVALVPHVPLPECQAILRTHRLRINLTESVLCGGNEDLVDVCNGDSGGPLGYKEMIDGRPRFVQFGIVSFGAYFCGDGNAPNVYTNVSHYLQWITDNIRG